MRRVTAIVLALCVVGAAVAVRGQNRIASGSTYHTVEAQNVMPYSLWTSCVFWATCDGNPSGFSTWTVESFDTAKWDLIQATDGSRPGYSTGALTFAGIDDFASNRVTFTGIDGKTAFTLSAWVNPAVTNAPTLAIMSLYSTLATSTSDGFLLRLRTNNTVSVTYTDHTVAGGSNFTFTTTATGLAPSQTWTHVCAVVTLQPTNAVIYVNAVAKPVEWAGDAIPGVNLCSASKPMEVGSVLFAAGRSGYFNGKLDELGVFNRALTAAEVTNLYNVGNRPKWVRP